MAELKGLLGTFVSMSMLIEFAPEYEANISFFCFGVDLLRWTHIIIIGPNSVSNF